MRTSHGALRLAAYAALACSSACSPIYYSPNSQNVPLFRQKGEWRIAGGQTGTANILGSNLTGGDFQGAYAVTDHVGVMANMYLASKTDNDTGEGGRGNLFEGGAGYFRPVSRRVVLETYAGAGFGSLTHTRRSGLGPTSSVGAQRFFLQPSLGFTSRAFDVAASLRMCGLNYSGIPAGSTDSNEAAAIQALRDHTFSALAEPAITIRAGWKHVKAQLQFGWSKNLSHPDFPQADSYVSIGVSVAMKR